MNGSRWGSRTVPARSRRSGWCAASDCCRTWARHRAKAGRRRARNVWQQARSASAGSGARSRAAECWDLLAAWSQMGRITKRGATESVVRPPEDFGVANWQRRLIGLGLPCLLPWMLDVGLTLHGQPAAYWAGDYARTTEGAAFYRRLYAVHPAAGVGEHLVWVGLVGGLLVLLPAAPAVVLALAVAVGHTWGAS